jgi:polygalacturonase
MSYPPKYSTTRHSRHNIPRAGVVRLVSFFAALVMLFLPSAPVCATAAQTYLVTGYGAKGDDTTIDTAAINATIAAAAVAGGGTVEFPAGTYLSTSIHLQSNITLLLDAGATIKAAKVGPGISYDPDEPNPLAHDYQDFGHTHFQNSLIWGENLSNISILGPGRIWGDGLVKEETATPDGNKSISLELCHNVILRDFTIFHGGWFGILATGDDNLTIDNLKIDTNRDGMDIDSCRNVHIFNCTVNSPADDGICLKSTYALGYTRATENVTISNCIVSGFDEGSVLDNTYRHRAVEREGLGAPTGRIKFGTESNGGFKNITITNCVFENCEGLALETVDGGDLEDIAISNITMRDIFNAPIFLRLGARLRGPAGTQPGELQRITISNVVVYNADPRQCCLITGIPGHDIKDLTLSNIQIWYRGGGTSSDAAVNPPELIDGYPDPARFGTMPAYGLFVRHVDGLTLDNVLFHTLAPDKRPAILFDDVANSRLLDCPDAPITSAPDATH